MLCTFNQLLFLNEVSFINIIIEVTFFENPYMKKKRCIQAIFHLQMELLINYIQQQTGKKNLNKP